MRQKKILEEIVIHLHDAFPEASIGIGGSMASNTYRNDSDIDILFVRTGCRGAYSVSFSYKGINVSLFSFSKDFLYENEGKYLSTYHNMPVAFIADVSILYDDEGLIFELKGIIANIIARRTLLRKILIDNLKEEIRCLFQMMPQSVLDKKKNFYKVVDKIVSMCYLKSHANRITQKQEGRNPFGTIMQEDYLIYDNLKSCLPYTVNSDKEIRELFENYIIINY